MDGSTALVPDQLHSFCTPMAIWIRAQAAYVNGGSASIRARRRRDEVAWA
ncbi:hypothetical protein PQR53_17650 [Paraburkholderia fungorum]